MIAAWGTQCYHCAQPIDLRIAHPHPRSFSIEHLTPRSHAGADQLTNLRPSHLGCNCARGNRPITDRSGDPIPQRRRENKKGRFSCPAPGQEVPQAAAEQLHETRTKEQP